MEVLQHGPDDAKDHVAGDVSKVAECAEHRHTLVAGGAVLACLQALQQGPDDAKDNAADTLSKIAESTEHRAACALLAAGTVPVCMQNLILSRGDNNAQGLAALILSRIAKSAEHVCVQECTGGSGGSARVRTGPAAGA